MTTLRTLMLLIALTLLEGCADMKYGSRPYEVVLDTVPSHCRAYLIPNTQWVYDKAKLLEPNSKLLEECENGITPWTVSKPPYVYVFVAVDEQQHVQWKEFKPSHDETVILQLETPPTPPAPEKVTGASTVAAGGAR